MATQSKTVKDKLDGVLGSGTVDKAEGNVKLAYGTAKDRLGQLIGDEQMQAEGHQKHAEGDVQHSTGEAKTFVTKVTDAVEDAADTIGDKIHGAREKVSSIYDHAKAKAEGMAVATKDKLAGAKDDVKRKL